MINEVHEKQKIDKNIMNQKRDVNRKLNTTKSECHILQQNNTNVVNLM